MTEKFHIYTPGPVKMTDAVLSEGARQLPYFRNQAFSKVLLSCEEMILEFTRAPKDHKVLFLGASGSGAMEAAVMNLVDEKDHALIINGGSFGQRFVEIMNIHHKKRSEVTLEMGKTLTPSDLFDCREKYSSIFINGHETSTGVLYDLSLPSALAQKNDALFIVDAISMFLTDPIDIQDLKIDALIISSQKGLGLPPGLSILVLSPKAQKKILEIDKKIASLYFKLSLYLKDNQRGQTPFTPPLSIIYQLHKRLSEIKIKGIDGEIDRARRVARYFRDKITDYPLRFFSDHMPNAMTALTPTDKRNAGELVRRLYHDFSIHVCPNGGELADTVFRVGHMGDVDEKYTNTLLAAFDVIYQKESSK